MPLMYKLLRLLSLQLIRIKMDSTYLIITIIILAQSLRLNSYTMDKTLVPLQLFMNRSNGAYISNWLCRYLFCFGMSCSNVPFYMQFLTFNLSRRVLFLKAIWKIGEATSNNNIENRKNN